MHRRGFTLMELLLVLAVMVVIAAMAVPSFKSLMVGQYLRKSADQVRVEFGRAHNRAMKEGVTYTFKVRTGTGEFRVEELRTENDYLESSKSLPTGPTTGTEKSLAEGINFQSITTGANTRDMQTDASSAMVGAAQSDGTWSSPVHFYPDGTSSNAEVVIVSTRNQAMRIKLRGLTSVALISDVMSAEELNP